MALDEKDYELLRDRMGGIETQLRSLREIAFQFLDPMTLFLK